MLFHCIFIPEHLLKMHHTESDIPVFIYKVLDYIHQNLSGDLRLEKLSDIASYSPFHFQKEFKKMVGESPLQYVKRLRLEKTAHYLVIFPNLNISDIAAGSGFSSLSTFSRAFKDWFGLSPEAYRMDPSGKHGKIGKHDSKKSKISPAYSNEFWSVSFMQDNMDNEEIKKEVTVKRMQAINLICLQVCLDSEDSVSLAFRKLSNWAGSRALITPGTRFIGALLDIPFITPLEKCRYRASIPTPSLFKESNGFCSAVLGQGLYASFVIRGDLVRTVKSLVWFNHVWLPDSGYKLDGITGFEVFSDNPSLKPVEQIDREILIPVKPA
jgi:AraC family transcriptional regulator